jgi:hypothetical protein
VSLLVTGYAHAYNETKTHPELTKQAVEMDSCVMKTFLIDYLGMPEGIKTVYCHVNIVMS